MRIGFVGCGDVAQAHARHIARYNHENRLVGVCDIDLERARSLAEKFGIKAVYTELDRFLNDDKPDVVHVLSPPQTHAALALKVMEAGSHVLVEKPMALSTEEADRMIVGADVNRVKLCVNHNLLFDPVILRARSLVRDGIVGQVVSVDIHYGFNIGGASGRDWVDKLPGGIFQNLAPHPLYTALEFIGEPVQVHVSTLTTGTLGLNTPDELRVVIEGKRVIGNVALSLGIRPNIHRLRIYGTRAILHVDLATKILWMERLRQLPRALALGIMSLESGTQIAAGTLANAARMLFGRLQSYHGLGNLIHAFYRCIENETPVPVSCIDARRVVAVFDRIQAKLANDVRI